MLMIKPNWQAPLIVMSIYLYVYPNILESGFAILMLCWTVSRLRKIFAAFIFMTRFLTKLDKLLSTFKFSFICQLLSFVINQICQKNKYPRVQQCVWHFVMYCPGEWLSGRERLSERERLSTTDIVGEKGCPRWNINVEIFCVLSQYSINFNIIFLPFNLYDHFSTHSQSFTCLKKNVFPMDGQTLL